MSVDALNVAIQDAGKQNKTRDRTGVGGSLAGLGGGTYTCLHTVRGAPLKGQGYCCTALCLLLLSELQALLRRRRGRSAPESYTINKCRVKVCTRIM